MKPNTAAKTKLPWSAVVEALLDAHEFELTKTRKGYQAQFIAGPDPDGWHPIHTGRGTTIADAVRKAARKAGLR